MKVDEDMTPRDMAKLVLSGLVMHAILSAQNHLAYNLEDRGGSGTGGGAAHSS